MHRQWNIYRMMKIVVVSEVFHLQCMYHGNFFRKGYFITNKRILGVSIKIYAYWIICSKYIMTDMVRNKGEKSIWYKLEHCKMSGKFETINDISDNVTLFQLIYMIGNVNHAVSISGTWMYNSNNENNILWWKNTWCSFIGKFNDVTVVEG